MFEDTLAAQGSASGHDQAASMTPTTKVHALELMAAVDPACDDIYRAHQEAWDLVAARIDGDASRLRGPYGLQGPQPTILFRRDGAIMRIRVSGRAMKPHAGRPIGAHLSNGQERQLRLRCALWRDVHHMDWRDERLRATRTRERCIQLLSDAGCHVLTMHVTPHVSYGRKDRCGDDIALPTADLQAEVRIVDALRLAHAWSHGVGRGRRFGMGMIEFG